MTASAASQRPAAVEHGQATEGRLLGLGQQRVAPVDRRPQRPLPRLRGARTAGEQAEAVISRSARSGSDSDDIRAAASSSASGMPSSCRQTWASASRSTL